MNNTLGMVILWNGCHGDFERVRYNMTLSFSLVLCDPKNYVECS
jgi:hypothetical protein